MADEDSHVKVVEHPLIDIHLTRLRDAATPPSQFRTHLHIIGQLMVFEATRHLETAPVEVVTPLATTAGANHARPVVLVPIFRAGIGMLNGISSVLPEAQFGNIGMYRNEETLEPESYYCSLPSSLPEADVILIDPMLATGHSSAEAVRQLKEHGAQRLSFVCLVACPEGIRHFHSENPEVRIFTAAIDEGLNEKSYIVPGLGDAGDRYFGTL